MEKLLQNLNHDSRELQFDPLGGQHTYHSNKFYHAKVIPASYWSFPHDQRSAYNDEHTDTSELTSDKVSRMTNITHSTPERFRYSGVSSESEPISPSVKPKPTTTQYSPRKHLGYGKIRAIINHNIRPSKVWFIVSGRIVIIESELRLVD